MRNHPTSPARAFAIFCCCRLSGCEANFPFSIFHPQECVDAISSSGAPSQSLAWPLSALLEQSGFWIEADVQDLEDTGPPNRSQLTIPQVYNVDGFAYESIMIFGLTILSSNAWEDRIKGEAFDKRNEVYLAFSRDGFYMTRPLGDDREPFFAVGEPDAWNEGNVQTVGAGCVIMGEPESETLRFFYSGRKNDLLDDGSLLREGHLGCGTLRRDGFASIEAGVREGQLATRPLRFDQCGRLSLRQRRYRRRQPAG